VVTINGREVPEALLNIPRLIDPGSVEVAARRSGYEPFTRTVKLEAKQQITVDVPPLRPIAPVASPSMVTEHQPTAAAVSIDPKPDRASRRRPPPKWLIPVAGSAAAVGAGGAVITGILATNHQAKLDEVCVETSPHDNDCPEDVAGHRRGLYLNRGLFVASAIVGAVGVTGLGYAWIVGKGTYMEAALSPTGVQLRAQF